MNRQTDALSLPVGVARAALWLVLSATVPVAVATPAGAQESLFERLNLDRLQLSGFGFAYGVARPSQLEPTRVYSLHAEYGEIAPAVRVVFSATFWRSRYTDDVVQAFADSLRRVIDDPTDDYTLDPGRVTLSDVALAADLRWTPWRNPRVRPYVGGGITAHVLNVEGRLVDGTFIERALDNITAGTAAVAGVDLLPVRQLAFGVQGRFDLLTGSRYASARGVVTYHFGGYGAGEEREGGGPPE